MAEQVSFSGSIPELYERTFVPLILRAYADELASRLQVGDGARVLELACGTGVVTRALAARLSAGSQIIATDISPDMLAVAQRLKPTSGPSVTFQQADALDLPFENNAFDAVICQFGLMLFPDTPQGLREAGRVLKPGAPIIAAVWDALEQNDFARVLSETLKDLFPEDPMTFFEDLPFSYYDLDQIRSDLEDAGFENISLSKIQKTSEAESAAKIAYAFLRGTPVFDLVTEQDGDFDAIALEAGHRLAGAFGDNPVRGQSQAILIQATAR